LKAALLIGVAAVTLAFASPAFAYSLKNETANGCGGDGSGCIVFCDSGSRAGLMYWNGSGWTDGTKSAPDKDTEARQICAANGSGCT
jgi:hypothetical protein